VLLIERGKEPLKRACPVADRQEALGSEER